MDLNHLIPSQSVTSPISRGMWQQIKQLCFSLIKNSSQIRVRQTADRIWFRHLLSTYYMPTTTGQCLYLLRLLRQPWMGSKF